MRIKVIEHFSISYWETVKLRQNLLRTPLGLEFTVEELQQERNDLHLGIFSEDLLLGCVVLSPISSQTARLRQLAVLPLFQDQGLGKKLVQQVEKIARAKGFQEIILHSRSNVNKFYEKLGYKKQGKPFKEITLQHQKMIKKL